MRCIFCKSSSSSSKSQEHIIPQSLGNVDHVLPPGIVYDGCNNYFSRKVEGPLLETEYFRQLRSRHWVPNKRGRVPPSRVLFPQSRLVGNAWISGTKVCVASDSPSDHSRLMKAIEDGRSNKFYMPLCQRPLALTPGPSRSPTQPPT